MTIDPTLVVVSEDSVASDDPADVVGSNVAFVNALREGHVHNAEIAPDALVSYYVDFYAAQVANGGFSQFVYNSGWAPEVVAWVRTGLAATGATRHLAVFERGADGVARLGREGLERFLTGSYFGESAERERLDEGAGDAYDAEDLVALNAAWLRARPGLVVLPVPAMERAVAERAAAVPDREARVAAARTAEPTYLQQIRALCDAAGLTLLGVTMGDPSFVYEGEPTIAWYFQTEEGPYYMVEHDGAPLLFEDERPPRPAAAGFPVPPPPPAV